MPKHTPDCQRLWSDDRNTSVRPPPRTAAPVYRTSTETRASDASRPQRELTPLVITDDPASTHGQLMASVLRQTTPVVWIRPSLNLSIDLLSTPGRVVAVPLRVRGGDADDPFTATLMNALRHLRTRGCLVFVARGLHPNPLADVGIGVPAPADSLSLSASQACVAAAERAWLRSRELWRAHHG